MRLLVGPISFFRLNCEKGTLLLIVKEVFVFFIEPYIHGNHILVNDAGLSPIKLCFKFIISSLCELCIRKECRQLTITSFVFKNVITLLLFETCTHFAIQKSKSWYNKSSKRIFHRNGNVCIKGFYNSKKILPPVGLNLMIIGSRV